MQGMNSLYHLRDACMRLTLVRECLQSDVFMALSQLLDEIENGDNPDGLVWAYHEFASQILALEDTQVTGDRWKDHMLALALEMDTAFTRGAAQGKRDEVLLRAEMRDLAALEQLYYLSDERVIQWMEEKHHVDARSWIRWSMPEVKTEYGEKPLAISRELLADSCDWAVCAQPLWDFFHTYGSGVLLASNNFWLEDRLYALQRIKARALEVHDIWPAYAQLEEAVRGLQKGVSARHVVIAAEDGQRFAVHSLLALGDDVRVIEVAADGMGLWSARLGVVFREVEDMPGANIVYIDIRGQDMAMLQQFSENMGNIMVIAAVDESVQPEMAFGMTYYKMPELPEMAFADLVARLVRQNGRDVPREEVESALGRYKGRKYSIEAAKQIAEEIIKTSGG